MPRGTVLLLALSALAGAVACSRMPTAPSLANGAPNLPDTLLAKPGPPTVTTLNAQLVTSGSSDGQGPGTEVASPHVRTTRLRRHGRCLSPPSRELVSGRQTYCLSFSISS